jgi:hypothetical protein
VASLVEERQQPLPWVKPRRSGTRWSATCFPSLAPRGDANSPSSIPDRNTLIRALASDLGVHLIDLTHVGQQQSDLEEPSLNIGDGVHYTEAVRTWLGDQIVSWMSAKEP